jgi:DNA-binding IclR family transcriptional regulator
MYAPLHPVLVSVLENIDGRQSVRELAELLHFNLNSLAEYLNTLSDAGFVCIADSN